MARFAASNLDLSQEIEDNRINEIIEATLAMSTRIQTEQETNNLNHSLLNSLVASTSGAVPRSQISKNENRRAVQKPKVSKEVNRNHERRNINRRTCEKPDSHHKTHFQILLNKNTPVNALNSQTGKKYISRPIPILQTAKSSVTVNSKSERPRSLSLGVNEIPAQNLNCSDPLNAVINIKTKRLNSCPEPNAKPSVLVPTKLSRVNGEERKNFPYPEVLDIFSEYDDTLPNKIDNECEKERNDITVSPSLFAFSYTRGNFFTKKLQNSSLNEPDEDRKSDLFTELSPESSSLKSLTDSGGALSEKFGPACEKEGKERGTKRGSECEKERNDIPVSPSPLAFSYTQGNCFTKKLPNCSSIESCEDRKSDLFTELFLESSSLKSCPNSAEESSEKIGPACERVNEVVQSKNISSSLENSLLEADNKTQMLTCKENIQDSSTQIVHPSFSESPNQNAATPSDLPSNISNSQTKNLKAPIILEDRNNEDTSDARNLRENTVNNKSVQLLTSLTKSQNLTHQALSEVSSEGDKLTFAERNQTLTDICSMFTSPETGRSKKPKPAVPPKPRLRPKEHASDASKRHSYCENGKVNPAPFKKCLDEMFNKQTDARYSSSQMNNDVTLNENEANLEFSKDITTEQVWKAKHSFKNKLIIFDDEDPHNCLKRDILTSKTITNEENATFSVSTNAPVIIHPLMPEYERTSQGNAANSCNIAPFTRSSSASNDAVMNDMPRRQVVSFPESQERDIDLSAWAPPRPSLPQKLKTTNRSLSCSSLVQTFKELGFSKKGQPFSGKNKNAQNKGTSVSIDSHQSFPSPPGNCNAHSITIKEPAWFHDIDSAEANRRLLVMKQDGAFLVRPSSQKQEQGPANTPSCIGPTRLTVCVTVAKRVLNLRVRHLNDGTYALGSYKPGEQTFQSLMELIKYHQDVPLEVTLGGKMEVKRNVRFLVTPPKEVF